MLNPNSGKSPITEKVLSVMEKEFGEIKKGMVEKLEGKKLVIFGLGLVLDCLEKAQWEEVRDSIQLITIKRGV